MSQTSEKAFETRVEEDLLWVTSAVTRKIDVRGAVQ